jgi:anti-sigma factor RsiW
VRRDELNVDDLACKEIVELVTEHLEGGLDPELADGFVRHLADCVDCSAYVEQLRAAIALSERLQPQDVPEPVMDALLQVFREAKRAGTDG